MGWTASVERHGGIFVGYIDDGATAWPRQRNEKTGEWSHIVTKEKAGVREAATLEFLCAEAERRGVATLSGRHGSEGPEVMEDGAS